MDDRSKSAGLLVSGILALGSSSDEPPNVRLPVTALVVFREHDHVPEMELHAAIASPVVSQITTGSMSAGAWGNTLCTADLTTAPGPAKA